MTITLLWEKQRGLSNVPIMLRCLRAVLAKWTLHISVGKLRKPIALAPVPPSNMHGGGKPFRKVA